MTAKAKRIVTAVIILAVAAGVFLWITRGPAAKHPKAPPSPQPAEAPAAALGTASRPLAAQARPLTTPAPASMPVRPPTSQPPLPADASLAKGLQLMQSGKPLEARRVLSALIFGGTLSDAEAEQARTAATQLADETLFSKKFFDGDPYTFQYTCVSGDTLAKVERDLKLHVPTQLILRINGLARGNDVRAGQSIKMIQGPFHAIVTKRDFTLDLYLQREGTEKVFVKRLKVGLGADGSTPVGAWKVGKGTKMLNATWFPPASSPVRDPQRPGDPNYPLGRAGYWIGLVGTDLNTASSTGYGIHGTNDPNSIGQAASLGCIRLADPDIERVFSLLYEEWSSVQVMP